MKHIEYVSPRSEELVSKVQTRFVKSFWEVERGLFFSHTLSTPERTSGGWRRTHPTTKNKEKPELNHFTRSKKGRSLPLSLYLGLEAKRTDSLPFPPRSYT